MEIGLDGEALVLDPPIEFRTLPGALRSASRSAPPGTPPAAAAAPTKGWATITAALHTAAGQPVAIGELLSSSSCSAGTASPPRGAAAPG